MIRLIRLRMKYHICGFGCFHWSDFYVSMWKREGLKAVTTRHVGRKHGGRSCERPRFHLEVKLQLKQPNEETKSREFCLLLRRRSRSIKDEVGRETPGTGSRAPHEDTEDTVHRFTEDKIWDGRKRSKAQQQINHEGTEKHKISPNMRHPATPGATRDRERGEK